jgi:hypothetical protein
MTSGFHFSKLLLNVNYNTNMAKPKLGRQAIAVQGSFEKSSFIIMFFIKAITLNSSVNTFG